MAWAVSETVVLTRTHPASDMQASSNLLMPRVTCDVCHVRLDVSLAESCDQCDAGAFHVECLVKRGKPFRKFGPRRE